MKQKRMSEAELNANSLFSLDANSEPIPEPEFEQDANNLFSPECTTHVNYRKIRIEGYAVVYDTLSVDLGGFKEIIHKGALTDELVKNSDVFARLNHNPDIVYARSNMGKGQLKLKLDDKGLFYSFPINHKSIMTDLVVDICTGVISKSSFAFTLTVDPSNEFWEYDEKEQIAIRHIYKITGLYDVSPVHSPAYPATSCIAKIVIED